MTRLEPTTATEIHAVKGLVGQVARDGVSLQEPQRPTHWFWIVADDGTRVGTVAWMELRGGWARFRSLFVYPEYRGHGHATAAQAMVLDLIRQEGTVSVVDQYAANPAHQGSVGWEPIGRVDPRNGAQRMALRID